MRRYNHLQLEKFAAVTFMNFFRAKLSVDKSKNPVSAWDGQIRCLFLYGGANMSDCLIVGCLMQEAIIKPVSKFADRQDLLRLPKALLSKAAGVRAQSRFVKYHLDDNI